MSEVTPDRVIAAYLRHRAQRDEIAERHKTEMAPVDEAMTKLGGWLLHFLQQNKAQNVKIDGVGTAMQVKRVTVKLVDPDAFYGFVEATGLDTLLQTKPDQAAIKEYIEGRDLPPGLELETAVTCQVRVA